MSTEEQSLITTEVQTENTTRADRPDETVLEARSLDVYYGQDQALTDVSIEIPEHKVTAMIGPSGCGKSTFLRSINRMNDQIDACRVDGELSFHGKNVYDEDVDPVALRRKIGQVFQKPNPFPKSIYENVAYGLRVRGRSTTSTSTTPSNRPCVARPSGTKWRANSTRAGSTSQADNNSVSVSRGRSRPIPRSS